MKKEVKATRQKIVPKTKTVQTKTTKNNKNVYYTIFGKHKKLTKEGFPTIDKDGDSTYAKSINGANGVRYFVKVGTYGKIFNPIGLYSEGMDNKFLSRIGKKAWDYKEVNSKVFNMYLSFLKTKNVAWLNNAQRELS